MGTGMERMGPGARGYVLNLQGSCFRGERKGERMFTYFKKRTRTLCIL